MNPNNRQEEPPLQQASSTTPLATAGTEKISFTKRWLPRLIVTMLVVNITPPLLLLIDKDVAALGETIRSYVNIVLIVAFLIIIIKTVWGAHINAKN